MRLRPLVALGLVLAGLAAVSSPAADRFLGGASVIVDVGPPQS